METIQNFPEITKKDFPLLNKKLNLLWTPLKFLRPNLIILSDTPIEKATANADVAFFILCKPNKGIEIFFNH